MKPHKYQYGSNSALGGGKMRKKKKKKKGKKKEQRHQLFKQSPKEKKKEDREEDNYSLWVSSNQEGHILVWGKRAQRWKDDFNARTRVYNPRVPSHLKEKKKRKKPS